MTRLTEELDVTANIPHLLSILSDYLNEDPYVCVREYVSNAHDACGGQAGAEIRVAVEGPALVISDNGCGMTREVVIDGFVAIAGHRAREAEEANTIGMFGLGVLSAFMVSDTLVVETRSEKEPNGWKLTWGRGKARFTLEPADRPRRGTVARLFLADAFRHLASEPELRRFVARTFALLSVPVYVGRDAQPANRHLGWLAESLAGGPERLLLHPQSAKLIREQTAVNVSAVYAAAFPGKPRVLLGIPTTEQQALNEHNVVFFRKGVRVDKRARKFLPENLAFVVGLVDEPGLKVSVDRDRFLEDEAFSRARDHVAESVLRFLDLLAEANAQVMAEALRTHCTMLLAHAKEEPRLLELFRKHFRFETTSRAGVRWADLAQVSRDDPADPYGPKVIYYYDRAATQQQANYALRKGYEVVRAAEAGVEFLLKELGRADGLRVEPIDKIDPPPVPVPSQGFVALMARLTRFLHEKAIGPIEFITDPGDHSTPAQFRTEQSEGPTRRDAYRRRGAREEGVVISVAALQLNVAHPLIRALAERVDRLGDDVMREAAELLFSVAALKSPFDQVRYRVTDPVVERLVNALLVRVQETPVAPKGSEYGKCFVALPFRASFANVWHGVRDVLAAAPYHWKMTRADEDVRPVGLVNSVMAHIDSSQRFIADVSGYNQNVLLELGMMLQKSRHATLILADQETANTLPIDLRGETCAVYEPSLRDSREAMQAWFQREVPRHTVFSAMVGNA